VTDHSWIAQRLSGDGLPIIIDGGMGTELEKSGVPMDDKVWSARAMLSHPEMVRGVHERYIQAGAEAIITNTFSSARHMLEPGGLGREVRNINLKAVELAREARDAAAKSPVALVGSICEWAHDEHPTWNSPEVVGRAAAEQAQILADAGVEVLAVEMCERVELSDAVVEAVMSIGLPVWLGVSARRYRDQDHLSAFGYPERDFEELVRAISKFSVDLINVMHTPVSDVPGAIEVVRNYWKGPVGVYPESGEFMMPNWDFVDVIEPSVLAENAVTWAEDGIRLIGGCCGLGPAHIRACRDALTQHDST
jgi:S-methylmethionine-dependent homocysteine/selenocysteine methylase